MPSSRTPLFNKDVLILFTTLLFSLVLLFTRTSPQIRYLKFQILKIGSTLAYPSTWYKDVFSIREENKFLKDQIIKITLLNAELLGYEKENKKLKDMLNFINNQPLSFITANVVNYHFGIPTNSITVDIGAKDSIIKNLTVMDENGLLGKTVKVKDHSALAQLITDKNFRVSIRVGEERALGLFIPTHGKFGLLEGVRKSMPLEIGEIAYTSGISDIYPNNIPVAKVVSVDKYKNDPFQHVVVEIIASIDNLDYVFIIF
jgi:rod shape-determining protein MreC